MNNRIKKDILLFGIPGLTVFLAGLIVSGADGYNGLVGTLWGVIKDPEKLSLLSAWNIAGLCAFVIGIGLAIRAQWTLKRFYSSTLVTRENHQLITQGPYRFVRHPIYFGVIIAILGVPLYAASLKGALVLSLLIPIILYRIKMEEEMLTEYFGEEYQAYQKSTKKLIPFLY